MSPPTLAREGIERRMAGGFAMLAIVSALYFWGYHVISLLSSETSVFPLFEPWYVPLIDPIGLLSLALSGTPTGLVTLLFHIPIVSIFYFGACGTLVCVFLVVVSTALPESDTA